VGHESPSEYVTTSYLADDPVPHADSAATGYT
jgi:hypothetical protein